MYEFIALQGTPSFLSPNIILILMMFVVIYFFMIRPQQKRQKEQQQFSESLERGKEVVTASGMIGKITKIENGVVTLLLDAKSHARVLQSNISKELTDAYHSGE